MLLPNLKLVSVFIPFYILQNDADERLENNSSADDAEYEEANELQIAEEMPPMSTVSEDESEVNQEFAITGIKCEFVSALSS